MENRHRSGVFKQVAKTHKVGRHRTKRKKIIKKLSGPGGKLARVISNADRKNQRKQWREFKNSLLQERARLEGGPSRAPFLVSVFSLDSELLATEVVEKLAKADETATITKSDRACVTYMNVPRFKARYGFLCPSSTHLESLLDSLKVSDVFLLLWPTDGDVSEDQKHLLDIILAHGTPTLIHVVAGLPPSGKMREQLRKQLEKKIDKWISVKKGIFFLDSDSNAQLLLRQIAVTKKKSHQVKRSYILAEEAEVVNEQGGIGTLKVTGYVRGPPLNVNKLVHIQGCGDFQIVKVEDGKDPRPLKERKNVPQEAVLLAVSDPNLRESLQSEVIPDPMDCDQPDPEEGPEFDGIFKVPKVRKKVPAGMSDYQASWIVDAESDGEDAEDDEDDSEDEDSDDESSEGMGPIEEEAEMETKSVGSAMNETISMAGIEDRPADFDEVQRFRDEQDHQKWPDQVDTPMDMEARIRFQKYRGLKSFRTSPWDPKENLPLDFARIFKFANYARTKKLVLKDSELDYSNERECQVAKTGSYVTVYVANVPSHILDGINPMYPFALYGLMKHEQKFSVMNVVLKKYVNCQTPIKNKESLIFHVGSRRFEIDPVFSQHSTGDKYKMERYMPSDTPFVASYYGPVTFGPCPVLVFRRTNDEQLEFVAHGSVLNANPDRVVLKRVVLSGYPYKINKRSAVVRFMFFNKEDIDWFKPVEIYTDSGLRGHIKDSVGTHGLMKCVFNMPLGKQDTIKLNLFKRVFPRWSYAPYSNVNASCPVVGQPAVSQTFQDVEME